MARDKSVMVGAGGTEPSCSLSYTERRKLKKVQVERNRRERINRSMGALRELVCQGRPEMAADIDRAQILELAVSFIRHYQNQRHHRHNHHVNMTSPPHVMTSQMTSSYYDGYSSATTAIASHLDTVSCPPGVTSRLLSHLTAIRDTTHNMMSSPRLAPPPSSRPRPPSDVTSKTGPLYVDVTSHDDSDHDVDMDQGSPHHDEDHVNNVNFVDENNNNDVWRPW